MKKLVIIIASCLSLNAFSQNLSGSYLGIWSSDSHLGQFGFYDAGQTRPRVDIWGFPNKINFRTTYNTGGAALSFGTNAVNEAILINEDGNVGIGTTTPATKLEIYNSNSLGSNAGNYRLLSKYSAKTNNNLQRKEYSYRHTNGTDWTSSAWIDATDIDDYFAAPFHRLWWLRDPANLKQQWGGLTNTTMTLDCNNGRVGIGTISPYGKLHVYSQNSPAQYYDGELHIGGFIGNTNDVTMIIGTHYTNKTTFLQGWKAGYGSTPILLQPQGGNVCIGATTNPNNYKLAVEGTIAAREVKVTAESWADFVFHPTYKLRTLGEVEQFIKANNHLPEIPTEVEVKENGVGLGEMNAKLLQKIEELTLYMIEMKKENEKQKLENQLLKDRIEKIEEIIR